MGTTGGTESGPEANRADAAHLTHAVPATSPAQSVVRRVKSATAGPPQGRSTRPSRERELLELLPDAYLATDLAGRILEANAAASDLFALAISDLQGRSLLDFVAREDAGRVAAVLAGEAAAASNEPMDVRLRSASGYWILAELRARPWLRGRRRVQLRWFVRDVTAQRRTERELREQAGRYRQLATRLPVICYSLDADDPAGGPRFVSPHMAELFGFPVTEWLAVPELWIRQIHPDDRGRVLAERTRAREKVTAMRCEYRMLTRDGHVRWVREEAQVINGKPSPTVEGIIVDVTSRAGYGDGPARPPSRRGAITPDEDGNRRTFLRLFLHDVRSPLAVAVAIVEALLREEDALPVEQRRDLLTRAVTNLAHIHHLLTEVVDIERLEQRQVAVRLEPTDVRTVVEQVVAAVGETDHPLEFRGSACIVNTDASLVERAVSKLLDNALKHTPPATGIRVWVEDVGDGVLVSVEDEGPGVPDELKERIFEAFDRGRAPGTTAGFGLGLALVRHIVHVLGGQTWVEDRPGGGASFRLLLPSGPT